jgi:hypothetical protein
MKKLILTITGLLMLLSSCDNMIDLSDHGTVNIKLASAGSSRYIAGDPDDVNEAILGFIEQDVMYNFDFIEDITDFDGQHQFTGIPVGDYSFLAMLLSDNGIGGEIISMAIQPVTIEAGSNDLIIEMGPGFHFVINDVEFDMGDLSNDFSLSLSGNEVTIGVSAEQMAASVMTVKISSNAAYVEILDSNDLQLEFFEPEVVEELTFVDFNFIFNPTEIQRFQLKLASQDSVTDPSINEYVLIFKEI